MGKNSGQTEAGRKAHDLKGSNGKGRYIRPRYRGNVEERSSEASMGQGEAGVPGVEEEGKGEVP